MTCSSRWEAALEHDTGVVVLLDEIQFLERPEFAGGHQPPAASEALRAELVVMQSRLERLHVVTKVVARKRACRQR